MIGVIPNPKKNIVIDKDINSIKESISLISLLHPKYKTTSSDDMLKQYTFEATELLSLGVYIDINITSIEDNKTDVVVEIKRKIGSFDKSHEVTNANGKIQKVFELISKGLQMSEDEINQLKTDAEEKKETFTPQQEKRAETNKTILGAFLIAIIIGSVVYVVFL
jgi:hypothetical protein